MSGQLAFPTAKGAGAYTTGGRGGIVVHVTNTNATGAGSFKEALSMTVPRTIVFDVSGIINIEPLLYISSANSNLTIAGQTSPEGGVTIAGGRVYFEGVTNYIMRHIRFKGGFQADWMPNSGDNLGSASFSGVGVQQNIIVDHVSFGFGSTMPTWTSQGDNAEIVDNLTVQNCLFAESNKGVIIGKDVDQSIYRTSGSITFTRNVFYNHRYRSPNVVCNHENNTNDSFDVINNLTWNAQGRFIRGAGNQNLNHINNATYVRNYILNDNGLNLWSTDWTPKIYTNGNLIVASNEGDLTSTVAQMNADNTLSWKFFVGSNYGEQLPNNFFVSTPYPIRGVEQPILEASELRTTLPSMVGCNARLNADGSVSSNLDTHDASYLSNILDDIIVPPIDEINYVVDPIPSVSRPVGYYNPAKSPDIPETWYDANVTSGASSTDLAPDGYTWLEKYINQVDSLPANVPVITLIGDNVINIYEGDTYVELNATASDLEDGDISSDIVITGTVDTSTIGTYYRYYNVTDSELNDAIQVVRTINVLEANANYPLTPLEKIKSKVAKLLVTKTI